jgi:hypothetical protein
MANNGYLKLCCFAANLVVFMFVCSIFVASAYESSGLAGTGSEIVIILKIKKEERNEEDIFADDNGYGFVASCASTCYSSGRKDITAQTSMRFFEF